MWMGCYSTVLLRRWFATVFVFAFFFFKKKISSHNSSTVTSERPAPQCNMLTVFLLSTVHFDVDAMLTHSYAHAHSGSW
jgi:hypothetical protein